LVALRQQLLIEPLRYDTRWLTLHSRGLKNAKEGKAGKRTPRPKTRKA